MKTRTILLLVTTIALVCAAGRVLLCQSEPAEALKSTQTVSAKQPPAANIPNRETAPHIDETPTEGAQLFVHETNDIPVGLTNSLNLSAEESAKLSGFIRAFRIQLYDEFARTAKTQRTAPDTVRVMIGLPTERAQQLRSQFYSGLAEILGLDRLEFLAAAERSAVLDDSLESFGEKPSIITVRRDKSQTSPPVFVEVRTDTQLKIGNEVLSTYSSGRMLISEFVARYGRLSDLALSD